jgi:hypothetical protein
MPQVTVYIRKEDLDKWEALEKKSEHIHKLLNGDYHTMEFVKGSKISEEMNPFGATKKRAMIGETLAVHPNPRFIKTSQDAKKVVGENLCSHGKKYGVCVEADCLTAHRMGVR